MELGEGRWACSTWRVERLIVENERALYLPPAFRPYTNILRTEGGTGQEENSDLGGWERLSEWDRMRGMNGCFLRRLIQEAKITTLEKFHDGAGATKSSGH